MAQVVVIFVGLEVIKAQLVKQLVALVGLEHIQVVERQVALAVQIGMLNVTVVIKMVALLVIADTKYQVQVV